MRFKKSVYAVDSHTMGEPTRVIVGGIPNVPGNTMMEKKHHLEKYYDNIRTGLMLEPRGHRDMFGAIILPACNPKADLGVVFLEGEGFVNMCGHGSIGVCSVAIETGLVEAQEPHTEIMLESPAGLIEAKIEVEQGRAKSVKIINVESFLLKGDVEANIPGLGEIVFDIAYGGNFAILIDTKYFGVDICPDNLPILIEKSDILNKWVNENIEVKHPILTDITGAAMVEIFGPSKTPGVDYQNAVIFGNSFDRSPCGVGTCAKMAALVAKGELAMGDNFVYESIIKTQFRGRPIRKAKVGDFDAIVPELTASAFITGFNHFVFDDEDPVLYGFEV